MAWSLSLILGGAVCIIGISLGNRGMRLLVERASMLFLGFSAPAYSFAVIAVAGLRGLYPAAITFAFGLACIWRWAQITRELNSGLR